MADLQQLTIDVSCIKKEEEEDVAIKTEPVDEITADKLWTEIDIGPVKLEENVYNNIKKEDVELETVDNEPTAKAAKSHNRREVVRDFHQRILQLDKQQTQAWSHQAKTISNAEHMRDLRQRLMNLEQSANSPTNNNTEHAKPSSQKRRELEQRLMDIDSVHRAKRESIRQRVVQAKFHSETAAAQRMRKLRQRRQDSQSAQSKCSEANNSVAPELSVNRMQEFRDRLLNVTKVAATTKTQKQVKRSKHKKTIEESEKLSKPGI